MIAWLNVGVLAVSTALTVYLYIKSVGPEALSRRIGPGAYKRCARYRAAAMVTMAVAMACCFIYYHYPLPIPFLPQRLPWQPWASALAAVVLAAVGGLFMGRGLIDAGEEAAIPKKEHGLYGGIYKYVRHPQAWEVAFWFVIALFLHLPFLLGYAILWLPLEYWMVMSEEKDLVLRFGEEYEAYRRRTPAFWPEDIWDVLM